MSNGTKCAFIEMIDFLTSQDSDQIYNPETYKQCSTFSGFAFGKESRFTLQYVMGNGYAQGSIGDHRFRLFWSHLQGFQLTVVPAGEVFEWQGADFLSGAPHRHTEIEAFMQKALGIES